ncbi:MAG TPA: cobalamin-dependent protein, partial [bacterium]|nr:cobalamin-dependent protein [bacterium]
MHKKQMKVLLVTGFAPVKLPQLVDMGIPTGSINLLSHLAGKETLHVSIPTVAPAVLGSYLKSQGIGVEARDYFLDDLSGVAADVVGISSTFMGLEDIQQIAARVRALLPQAVVVLGGPLSWSLPAAAILAAVPELDYIIIREGERALAELVRLLQSGGDP